MLLFAARQGSHSETAQLCDGDVTATKRRERASVPKRQARFRLPFGGGHDMSAKKPGAKLRFFAGPGTAARRSRAEWGLWRDVPPAPVAAHRFRLGMRDATSRQIVALHS